MSNKQGESLKTFGLVEHGLIKEPTDFWAKSFIKTIGFVREFANRLGLLVFFISSLPTS